MPGPPGVLPRLPWLSSGTLRAVLGRSMSVSRFVFTPGPPLCVVGVFLPEVPLALPLPPLLGPPPALLAMILLWPPILILSRNHHSVDVRSLAAISEEQQRAPHRKVRMANSFLCSCVNLVESSVLRTLRKDCTIFLNPFLVGCRRRNRSCLPPRVAAERMVADQACKAFLNDRSLHAAE